MRVRLIVACSLLFYAPALAEAQAPRAAARLVVGADRAVLAEAFVLPTTEPHLVAHPTDPDYLLAVVMAVPTDFEERDQGYCAILASENGGETWSVMREFREIPFCHDPWLALRADDRALFTALWPRSGENSIPLYRSADRGRTWSEEPLRLPGVHDHPTIALDPAGGDAYVLTAASVPIDLGDSTPSRGAGANIARYDFTRDRIVDTSTHAPAYLGNDTVASVVTADGTLVVGMFDYMSASGRSRDDFLERPRSWVVRSRNGGRNISSMLFVSESCDVLAGFPSLSIDRGDDSRSERLYWVCQTDRFGGVIVARSEDGGRSWTETRADLPSGETTDVRTPVLAVSPQGVVGVSWYDLSDSAERACSRIRFAASFDGGETFTEPVIVSSALSCPATDANGDAGLRWTSGGEYFGLAAGADGRFHLLWPDARSGVYSLRAATVRVQ